MGTPDRRRTAEELRLAEIASLEPAGPFFARLASVESFAELDDVQRLELALELYKTVGPFKDPKVLRSIHAGRQDDILARLHREARRVLLGLLNGKSVILSPPRVRKSRVRLKSSREGIDTVVIREVGSQDPSLLELGLRALRFCVLRDSFPFVRCERCGAVAWRGSDSRVRFCSQRCAGAQRSERHRKKRAKRR